MPLYFLELGLQIVLAIHAARTGRLQPWLYIILFIPVIGSVLYIIIEIVPEFTGGATARRVRSNVVTAVDPGRDYRAMARQVEIAPTVHNKLRLADECMRLGRTAEAIGLYESSATGLHATEPGIRLGLATARFVAADFPGTLTELDTLRHDSPDYRIADIALLHARALDGAGRLDEARAEYARLVVTFPGEEARWRFAELLGRTGAEDEAREQCREIIRRVELQGRGYRSMQRTWYDQARRALSAAG